MVLQVQRGSRCALIDYRTFEAVAGCIGTSSRRAIVEIRAQLIDSARCTLYSAASTRIAGTNVIDRTIGLTGARRTARR